VKYIVVATAVLMFAACGRGSSSLMPSTPTAPTTPTSPTTSWVVTQTFVSVTGADNCWVRSQRARLTGVGFADLEMTVTRSAGAISVQSIWFNSYTGTVAGDQFIARQSVTLEGGNPMDCGSGNIIVQQSGVSNLSGRFAADDQTLSATESNVYPLNTGETVTYTWDWKAKRQ
jgi:hypothetical protein